MSQHTRSQQLIGETLPFYSNTSATTIARAQVFIEQSVKAQKEISQARIDISRITQDN